MTYARAESLADARADSMFVANDTAGDTVWFDTAYFRGPVVADTAFAAVPFESTTPRLSTASLWLLVTLAVVSLGMLWRRK